MNRLFVLSLLFSLVFISCKAPAPSTPTAPTPPQIKLANDVTVLRTGLPVALTSLQAARTAGTITPADVTAAQNKILVPLALLGKAIDAELLTNDDWPTMKAKVLASIAKAGISGASTHLPTPAMVILTAVIGTYNSIATSVGGPPLQ